MTFQSRAGAIAVAIATALVLHLSTGATFARFHGEASATTSVSTATISAPTAVSGSCVLAVVTLSWTAAEGRVDSYQLMHSPDGVTYAPRGDALPASTTTTTDTQVLGTHWYRVRTVAGGFSADSEPINVTCL